MIPAQWGDVHAREREEECELFGEMPSGDDPDLLGNPLQSAGQQDELENAGVLHPVYVQPQPISGAQCVNGNLVRPDNSEEEPPSTACRQSAVHASGGVALGRGPSPPPLRLHCLQHQFHMLLQPPVQPLILESGHRYIRGPRRQEEVVHQMVQAVEQYPNRIQTWHHQAVTRHQAEGDNTS